MALRHVLLTLLLIYSPGYDCVATIQQVYAKHRGLRTHHNNFFYADRPPTIRLEISLIRENSTAGEYASVLPRVAS